MKKARNSVAQWLWVSLVIVTGTMPACILGSALLIDSSRVIVRASATNVPSARKMWSVGVSVGTGQPGGTQIQINSGNFLAFAADRVIVVDATTKGQPGGESMSGYRLLSLDRNTGTVRNQMDIQGKWGDVPSVFGTNNGQVALVIGELTSLLNPDLSATGIMHKSDATGMWRKYTGIASDVSPDGTTLGLTAREGTTFLGTDKLEPTLKIPKASASALITSISAHAALDVDVVQNHQVNGRIASAVNLVNKYGVRELFRGDCLPPGHFLTDDRLLIAGCGKIRILDTRGEIIKQTSNAGTGGLFAGVSQAGSRFALEYHKEGGDPAVLLYEQFIIYDAATAAPVARISVDDFQERQSWSAFSQDGRFFGLGSANELTLYQVP